MRYLSMVASLLLAILADPGSVAARPAAERGGPRRAPLSQSSADFTDVPSDIGSLAPGTAVAIEASAGSVTIRAHRQPGMHLSAQKHLGGPQCRAHYAIRGTTLQVSASDPSGLACAIDLDVAMPAAPVALSVQQAEGTLKLSGIRAPLTLALTQVNAVVGGTFSHLTAQLTNGGLSVQGLSGGGRIAIERGNLQVFFAKAATGELELQLGAGNATLTADATIDVSATAARGIDAGFVGTSSDRLPGSSLVVTGQVQGKVIVRGAGR